MADGRGLSPYVYVAVALPILVGVVAAVLAGTVPRPSGVHTGELVIQLPDQVWGLLLLSPVLVGIVVIVARRILGPSMSFERRGFVLILALALLALLFIAVFSHGSGSGGVVGVANPGSCGSARCTNQTNSNNSSNGGGTGGGGTGSTGSGSLSGAGTGPSIAVPPWAVFAVIAALSVCVAVVGLPGVVSALSGRRPRPRPRTGPSERDRAEAQRAVYEASQAIVRGEDPRTTIVRLYLRLLAQLGPRLGAADQYTPEEIRTEVLAPLLVRPDAAEALTRLFEEARYSTHALGPDAANRCQVALGLVESDLARAARAG